MLEHFAFRLLSASVTSALPCNEFSLSCNKSFSDYLSHFTFGYGHFIKAVGIRLVLHGGSERFFGQQQLKEISDGFHRHLFRS